MQMGQPNTAHKHDSSRKYDNAPANCSSYFVDTSRNYETYVQFVVSYTLQEYATLWSELLGKPVYTTDLHLPLNAELFQVTTYFGPPQPQNLLNRFSV